jgi:hypothetical protein
VGAGALTVLDSPAAGLKGDGTTDNFAAFRAAFNGPLLAGGTLRLGPGDFRVFMPEGASELCRFVSGLNIVGVPGRTTISFFAADGQFLEPLRGADPAARGVRIEGIGLRRASAWVGCLLAVDAGTDLAFRNLVIDGALATFPAMPAFGVSYASGTGAIRNVRFTDVEITGCNPGVGSPNQGFATVRGLHFTRCWCHDNHGTDFDLNAPNQTEEQEKTKTVPPDRPYLQSGIRIRDCDFERNLIDMTIPNPSGYAVAAAHQLDMVIEGCTARGYKNQVFHVEDRSRRIRIAHNVIESGCMEGDGGAICIITCSSEVTVTANTIDQSAVSNVKSPCVGVQGGALPGQLHQCPDPRPSGIIIEGNTLIPGAAPPIVNIDCDDVQVGVNLVRDPATGLAALDAAIAAAAARATTEAAS